MTVNIVQQVATVKSASPYTTTNLIGKGTQLIAMSVNVSQMTDAVVFALLCSLCV